jgi:hypothetical protein
MLVTGRTAGQSTAPRPVACRKPLRGTRPRPFCLSPGIGLTGIRPAVVLITETAMGKGDSKRGNKEAKKPKKPVVKVLATANSNTGKDLNIGGKKVK